MSDIVDRLRKWTHAAEAAPASDLMDEAADEIERLRLTDAEREAIERTIPVVAHSRWVSSTLRGLLERLTKDR